MTAGFRNNLVLAGTGSLALAALAPLPTLAAPSITLKASFDGSGNGGNPYAALTPTGNGNFYGTTVNGGVNGEGSIFEFDPTSGLVTSRASFTGFGIGNGSNPRAALTPAGNGNFMAPLLAVVLTYREQYLNLTLQAAAQSPSGPALMALEPAVSPMQH